MTVQTALTAATTCGLSGAVGASFSSWRRHVTVGQMLFAVTFACALSSTLPFALMAFFPSTRWYVGVPVSFVTGFLVFGIVAWLEKRDKKLPDASVQDVRDVILGKSQREGS